MPQIAEPSRAVTPRSVATNGARMCALTARTPFGTRLFLGLAGFVSDDGGERWSGRDTRLPPVVDADQVFSASVAWDPTEARFRAVLAFALGRYPPMLIASRDCETWEMLGELPAPPFAVGDSSVSYAVGDAGHEIVLIPDDLTEPLVARSSDGAPGSFVWSQGVFPSLATASGMGGLARLQHLGDNLVLTRLGQRGDAVMWVSATDGWRVVPAWALAASAQLGTFDRSAVFPGVFLLPEERGRFTIFYAADGDFSCWSPDDPCPCGGDCVGGTGTATWSIPNPRGE